MSESRTTDVESAAPRAGKACCAPSRRPPTRDAPATEEAPQPCGDHRPKLIRLDDIDFVMGTDAREGFHGDGEGPARRVGLSPFEISPHAVSNAEFARFVDSTGYVTDAQRYGWSFVFHLFAEDSDDPASRVAAAGIPWWIKVEGAFWAHPEGPASDVADRRDHPVVHVSWHDALAYCRWSGTRLPTEAEWEYAARGGLAQKRFAWGDELLPPGGHCCNIWQGEFPNRNTGEDGWLGTAPVDAFEANGFGLYNACGNVWEWCADTFSPNYHRITRPLDPICLVPTGRRSMRGGSYLCHDSYCNRYRVAARSFNTQESTAGHLGFRVARSPAD